VARKHAALIKNKGPAPFGVEPSASEASHGFTAPRAEGHSVSMAASKATSLYCIPETEPTGKNPREGAMVVDRSTLPLQPSSCLASVVRPLRLPLPFHS
jgi:hypothetical protein